MPETKSTLLVVEDDLDVADMLTAYFEGQGYRVVAVDCGEEAVRIARSTHPDLVILDIRLPDIDGYEVARRLRSYRRTDDIPIIFLTEKRQRNERLQGLELGADDYITKPFDIQELRLRVRNALRRTAPGSLTNPITGLPEGALVDERLRECLVQSGWAVLLISLDHLEDFREIYGFVAADDVLRALSLMIHNAMRDVGGPGDFLGQAGAARFLVVTTPAGLPGIMERIETRLQGTLDFFYPVNDRERAERAGEKLSVRMSRLSAAEGPFGGLEQLKDALLGLKGY